MQERRELPIVSRIRERVETMEVPRLGGGRILNRLFSGMNREALPIPEGVTYDKAVETLEHSPWAQNSGEGMVRALGLSGDSADQAKNNWAHSLAVSQVKAMQSAGARFRPKPSAEPTPAPVAAPPRTRRKRTSPPQAGAPAGEQQQQQRLFRFGGRGERGRRFKERLGVLSD